MATIGEELAVAKQAKAAIDGKPRAKAINALRKATRMATEQITTFRTTRALIDARLRIGIGLPPAIIAFKEGEPDQREKDKAIAAIEAAKL